MDFVQIEVDRSHKGRVDVVANYNTNKANDIMIRGRRFYAFWDEDKKLWSTDFRSLTTKIDDMLDQYSKEAILPGEVNIRYLRDSRGKAIDELIHYCEKQMIDNYVPVDDKLIFSNQEVTREDYATKTLSYPLEQGSYDAWDRLVGQLYSPEERHKIEWCIGAIVNGDSRWIQKCAVFVGDAGTGKSTIIKVIRELFEDYCVAFDAKAISNPNSSFALEPLKTNPLVAIQDDADLSRMEDNTRLNSLISHEGLIVNEKYKAPYEMSFHSFIFLGSNKEVQITDARSGLLRRLIDIHPTGNKIPFDEYNRLMNQIKFERGAIAWHCKEVYEADKRFYDLYFPMRMISATNHVYNFVVEDLLMELQDDAIDLNVAWRRYKEYCQDSNVGYPLSKQKFKVEMRAYFDEFKENYISDEGRHGTNRFVGFKWAKIGSVAVKEVEQNFGTDWMNFATDDGSIFDILCADEKAQYAGPNGAPLLKWENVTKKLENIDTHKLHYVKLPENHIVIDFDIRDENGNKSFERNIEAAKEWPQTYAEVSKSGAGIHLHYIYNGDIEQLSNVYAPEIEIKVFKGNASLRRQLTKFVNLPIATLTSGLPLRKEDKKVVDNFVVSNEKAIRTMIAKNLNKEYHAGTKPSIDYIYKILEDAYNAGVLYDVTDLRPSVLAFANNSSNHAEYCVEKVTDMKFCQDVEKFDISARSGGVKYAVDAPIIFYDVEVFPNLFVVCYKFPGEKVACTRLINPRPEDIEELCKYRMIGFNNRRYDNHIMYARMLGYSNEQLFNLSQKIVSGSKNCMFSEAYNLSYTDVYDFASAGNKMGLKKWEIKLDIHHLELGLPWDQPVPEELWEKVAEYCCNDVISTEIVFNHLEGDWIARQILADLSGLTVNDSTNKHTQTIIFGGERHPQSEFQYRDMSKPVTYLDPEVSDFLWERCPDMMKWWSENTDSLLPYFPGYKYERGKSYYKGIEFGEGGYVEAVPGMYGYTGLLDVASQHPSSIVAECLFGPYYTRKFTNLLDGRIDIKHKDWNDFSRLFDGKLDNYISAVVAGDIAAKTLSNGLKTPINSVYGLTAAKFENPFADRRNVDNIVAKRGELFMIDLAEEVKKRGFTVAHIKTDSIKIPDITDEMVEFVMEFGKRYGYNFEWEATYDKICLINKAVYIARYRNDDGSVGEWTATGKEFAEPFIFKTLFTHEDLQFKDYYQTKECGKDAAIYLDMNEHLPEGEHNYIFVGKTGSFVPIKDGCGGGVMLRSSDRTKYDAVVGTKGYRWLESEVVRTLGKENDVDISYFTKMADDAVKDIEQFGSFEWLVDPAPYNSTVPYGTEPVEDFMNVPEPTDPDDAPPWNVDGDNYISKED